MRLRDVGLDRSDDDTVLAYAAREGFITLPHDVNTMIAAGYRRMQTEAPLAGLFMVRQRDPIGPVIESLVMIWSASEAEEWKARVIYLPM